MDRTSRPAPSPESPLATAGPGSQQNLTEGLPNASAPSASSEEIGVSLRGETGRAFSQTSFPAHKCVKKSVKHKEGFPWHDSPHTLLKQNKA